MSGLEFASVTIGQVAWPCTLVVLALILRGPITKLFETSDVKSMEAGTSGITLTFERRLTQIEDSFGSSTLRHSNEADSAASDEFRAEMATVVPLSPRAAVLESYARLEEKLREALESLGERPHTMSHMVNLAIQEELLEASEASVFQGLTALRNSIAHDPEAVISPDDAHRYIRLAADTVDAIRAGIFFHSLSGDTTDISPPSSR